MFRTTLYLPDDLKRDIEAKAASTGQTEAEVMRGVLRAGIEPSRRKPRFGRLSTDDPIADRVDEVLAEGFGES